MHWLKELFQVDKPIIAMCHLKALPGDPGYDAQKGMDWIVEQARAELRTLQNGGVDAIMFSNEASLPYLTKVESITVACMARVIAELKGEIRVPFGVNVLWDPAASIDLAVATGGQFVREIFTGVYASDYGLWRAGYGGIRQHGVRLSNMQTMLDVADGAIIGTTFKHDSYIWNAVDESRVRELMAKVKEVRHG